MNKLQHTVWFSIAVVFAVCLTIFTLSNYITEPWHVLPTTYGDGMKNAFTYLYQSVYGKGFWFEGMNYPYGEHIVYTDGQPFLSVLFATCFKNVSVSTALTTLWWFIGLSYVLSIVYVYKTLTHFKVGAPIAIIFAGLITIFSPQVFRIGGQYGLSYLCVVPMLFYWTIKYNELSLWRYCGYIFVFGIIMTFLHPYYTALIMVWVLSYISGYLIFTQKKWVFKARHVLPIFISSISMAALVVLIIRVTDPVKDRPVYPSGLFDNVTRVKDIITSIYSPVWIYIKEHHIFYNFSRQINEDTEAYAYLGIVVTIAVIFSFIKGVVNKLTKNKQHIIVSKEGFSPIWLFMAFGILAFITIVMPFIWRMDWLLDHLSFLRQFRTIGRVIWIFYYIITIYGVIVINRYYTRLVAQRSVFIGYALLLLSIGLWSYEASGYTKYTRNISARAPGCYDTYFSIGEQNWESYLKEHHFAKNDFQAILMFDFSHIGSEKLWIEGGTNMTMAMKAAFQLHLPIIDVMMSRTSLLQTKKQVKIIAGPYAAKPILNDIKSDKPFLLIVYERNYLNIDEQFLLLASDYIGHYSRCHIYACYPKRLVANNEKNADSINKILPFMNTQDTCIVNKGGWYYNHLDALNAQDHLFGAGAMPRILGSDSNILLIPVKPLKDSQEYEFSCWFLLSDKDYASPTVFLKFLDSAGGVIATQNVCTSQSVDNYNMWFRASGYFCLRANCRAVSCKLINDPNPSYKIMDEILLRPSDALIISKAADGSVMVNNHLFKKATR